MATSQYKINRRPKDDTSDSEQEDEAKQEDDCEYTSKIQSILNSVFPTQEMIFESAEQAAAHLVSQFDDNIDWISTSYHLESSELHRISGKQACFEYVCHKFFKAFNSIGWVTKHHGIQINYYSTLLTIIIHVDFIFIDRDRNKLDPITGTDRMELNEQGKITRFLSVSQDFDIVSLIRTQYLLNQIMENDGILILNCLDEDFNKISFKLDKEKDKAKLKQIRDSVKEGEMKAKDVYIVVIKPKLKNGKLSSSIVSHAIVI